MKKLDEGLHKVSNVCVWISGVMLFAIAAFIFIDVLGRYIFNHPITGSQEIVELAIVCVHHYNFNLILRHCLRQNAFNTSLYIFFHVVYRKNY